MQSTFAIDLRLKRELVPDFGVYPFSLPTIRHLETLIDRLSALGATSTSTVLSSPVERRDYQAKQIESFAKYV